MRKGAARRACGLRTARSRRFSRRSGHQLICWEIAIDLGADKLRYEQREDRIVFEGPEGSIAFDWDKTVTISGAALSLREAR